MAETPAAHDNPSRLGRFIQNYSGFLSSFVIGVAGLVATSIWQFRQAQNAERQQASEQAIARTKADNDWRIARAEILGKNLSVLSQQGPQTADQRFGVLLSLTRGNILDPELAVSYALELGRDNPTYMARGAGRHRQQELHPARTSLCADLHAALRRGEAGGGVQGRQAGRSFRGYRAVGG